MSITPIDIQQHQFKTSLLGYEKSGVDQFLEMVAEELVRLQRESQDLREELIRVRATLEELRSRESSLKETLMTTQKVTEELKFNARREAEIMITDASLRAERIVRDAEDRRIKLISEIQEIKRQKITFESSLRALVESHMRLLDLEIVAIEGEKAEDLLLEEPLPFDLGDEVTDDESPEKPEK